MDKQPSQPFTRALRYLVNKLWLLLATLIILTALVFALLRLTLPQIDYFKADIENWIEEKYQVDVEIKSIAAEWGAKGPVFSLQDFKLNSDDGQLSLIELSSLSIHFDGLGTLLSGRVTTESIRLSGVSVNFLLDRQLGVRFDTAEDSEGQKVAEVQATSQVLLNNLFSHKKLVVFDSYITIETLTGRAFNYQISQLDIDNYDDIHQIKGILNDEHKGELQLVAEIFGDPSADGSYTNFYLEGKNVALSELPLYEKSPELKPMSGQLNWRLWSDWRDGRWQSALGDIQINNVDWLSEISATNSDSTNLPNLQTKNTKSNGPNVEQFSVDFYWRFDSSVTGSLVFQNGILKKKQSDDIPLPAFYLLYQHLNEQDLQWEIISRNIQFSPFVDYFSIAGLQSEGNSNLIDDAQLSLNFSELGIRLSRIKGQWQQPTIISAFDELDYQGLGKLPIVKGLTGEVSFVDGKGRSRLKAKNAELDFHNLFRNKLLFDEMLIDLNWQLDANNEVDLVIDSAYFNNPHLMLHAKSRFFFQDGKPNLSIFAELSNVDAAHKSLYLPSGIMGAGLVSYLDNSVQSGRLSLVKAVVHGPLEAFPFDNTEGQFSILGFLENSDFKYLPEWPAVTDFSAKLLFEGNGMDLRGTGGKAGLVSVNNARAVIKDYSAKNTPLELHIDANSVDNSGRDFIQQTPLKSIGEAVELLDYKGTVQTLLDLNLGLADSSNIKVKGKVIPQGKSASVTVAGHTFDQLKGELNIDEIGVKKSRFKAQYENGPVEIELVGARNALEPEVSITGKGRLSAKAITKIIGEQWASLGEGESDFVADVQVSPPNDKKSVILKFKSDLEGIALELPGELAKAKKEVTPLDVKIRLADESDVEINWGQFSGRWWWREKADDYHHIGGTFLFGVEQKLPQTAPNKYLAEINLGKTDWQSWSPILDRIGSSYQSAGTQVIPDIDIRIDIDLLENPYADIEQTRLSLLKPENANWQVQAKSPIAELTLGINDNQPWELEIEKLALTLKESFVESLSSNVESNAEKSQGSDSVAQSETEPEESKNNFWNDPANWPSIILSCKACQVQTLTLGEVKANLIASENGLAFNGNIKDGKQLDLNFNLDWLQNLTAVYPSDEGTSDEGTSGEEASIDDTSDENTSNSSIKPKGSIFNTTQLEFDLASNDVGKLMRRVDYESGVEDSRGRIIGKMSWSDLPWNFDLKKTQGKANFSLGEGYLSEVSDAKARLFSLLSLQSLSRRLQLDFSDVYKKGFFYNKLNGNISLDNGLLQSHDIYVDGSAAKVTLSGAINLDDRSIEQHALVVPQLTSSLPVLVGWAVEPTTGVLVFLLNKLFEPAIEVVTQIEYRIHGSLDEMSVDEIKKSKSKVKYETPEAEVSTTSEEDADLNREDESTKNQSQEER